MNELLLFDVCITAIAFSISWWLSRRFRSPLTAPTITATTIIVIALLLWQRPYSAYMQYSHYISDLLGPATVAFAVPLYRNRQALRDYAAPIFIGTSLGSVVGVTTGVLFAVLAKLPWRVVLSLAPKSVTTPIAMGVSTVLHGSPELTAVCVMIAGNTGFFIGPLVLRTFGIQHPVARGLAMGTASHGIGTAKAFSTFGQLDGAMGSLAIAIGGCVTALTAPLVMQLFNAVLHK